MSVRPGAELRRLLGRRLSGRALTDAADAVRVAGELVAAGCRVGLEHLPRPEGDAAAELGSLIGQVHAAGLADRCALTVPVDLLGADDASRLGALAADAGLAVVLAGPADVVDALDLPGAGVVVRAGEPDAEARCRALAHGQVRLVAEPGRRVAADLAFVRCLTVLRAVEGPPGIAVSDPRLIAIAGARAAGNGRPPDSWEYVMPFGVLIHEQRRLVAAGETVRVAVTWGAGGRS